MGKINVGISASLAHFKAWGKMGTDEKNIYFIKLEKKNCSTIIIKDIASTK